MLGINKIAAACALTLSLGALTSAATAATTLETIKKRGEIRIGVEPGFLPFEMQTKTGAWLGFDVDMMNAFAKSLGIKAKFIATQWDGIIPGLLSKKYDVIVSGMTITPERAKTVSFSNPYYAAGLKVMVNTKSAATIKSAKDLDSSKVKLATKLGTTGDIYAGKKLKKAKIRKFDREADAAQSVLFKQTDAFVYDKPYLELFVSSKGKGLSLLPGLLSEENFGLATRKKDKALLAAFNSFLAKWRASGDYKTAYDAAFVNMTWRKKFPELFKL